MCLPGIFVKLPKNQTPSVTSDLDNRSLRVLSLSHKGFVFNFRICMWFSNNFNRYPRSKVCKTKVWLTGLEWQF